MTKIKIIKRTVFEMDDAGQLVETAVNEPETPVWPLFQFYPNAVSVVSDGEYYTIFEQGD